MPSIKFLLQSKKEQANIYVRLSVGRGQVWKRKTGLTVNPKYWSKKKGMPLLKSDQLRHLKDDLSLFGIKLERAFNEAVKIGKPINSEWLAKEVDVINNRMPEGQLDQLSECIRYIIDTGHTRPNQKGRYRLIAKKS